MARRPAPPEGSADVPSGPSVDAVREVRLALVMYGGVSLAIYMNGVSQELFHLVRATAPKGLRPGDPDEALVPTSELTGTEAVYRKLGQALEAVADDPAATIQGRRPDDPITTRFVIDILSGTSAGGINAVFLAKALANGQSMDELEKLWIGEGDISVLLNDRRSRVAGLELERPPQSLLNSGRMYATLLNAFDAVERTRPNHGESRSPYVRELDLWVTNTDLRGVVLPLKIANGLAYERRYRNVLHFVYGTAEATGDDRNDFQGRNNPVLAFAARSTSAFPFAFRPMLYRDMAEPLRSIDAYRRADLEQPEWLRFFGAYFPPAAPEGTPVLDPEDQLPFLERPFADGGALDNKPFTWATDTLLRRRADVPVDRKLIFIEPDPGHPEQEATKQDRPDAIENFLLQGNTLPRQESVREDVQAVLERNRTIVRIDRVLQGLAEDLFPSGPTSQPSSGETWGAQGLEESVGARGPGYRGYHRLKVATVTDELSSLVASVAAFDEDSDELLAIGFLVRAWRDARFAHEPDAGRQPFNAFLVRFDLQYRLRRIAFLRRRVDALHRLNPAAQRAIGVAAPAAIEEVPAWSQASRDEFRGELRELKRALGDVFVQLRFLGRRLRSPGVSPLAPALGELGIGRERLRSVLEPATDAERADRARAMLEGAGGFDAVAAGLAAHLRKGIAGGEEASYPLGIEAGYGTDEAADRLWATLDPEAVPAGPRRRAREVLRRYAEAFEDFDMVAFPMLYGTDAGEADLVDVIRIAPEDATSIVDERASGFSKRKTRGWKYGHFGAFLSEEWRRNDILFGRLDAAECLIDALVPSGHADRDGLLEQAQRAIIQESLIPARRMEILGPEPPSELSDAEVVARFKERYRIEDELSPGVAFPIIARGVDVTGKMLEGISDARGAATTVTGLMAKIGSWFAGIVALGIPGSSRAMIFRHLVPLVLAFEIAMIGLGQVFGSPSVTRVGVWSLAITVLLWVVVSLETAFLQGARWPIRAVKIAILVVVSIAFAAVLVAAAAGIGDNGAHPSRYWDDLVSLYHRFDPAATPAP